jgi:hypothetical protein
MPSRRVFLAARQVLTPAHASMTSRQYAAMPAGAIARSSHKGSIKACTQSVSCRGLAVGAGAGAGAGSKSKPFYKSIWLRAAVSIAGGVVVYSWVDSSIFHPPSKDEVSFIKIVFHHPFVKYHTFFASVCNRFRIAFSNSFSRKERSNLTLRMSLREPNRSSTICSCKKAACARSASSSSARAGAPPPSWPASIPSATKSSASPRETTSL